MIQTVLQAYGIAGSQVKVIPFGSGLINQTWLVSNNRLQYILQRINDQIFKNPNAIAHNVNIIANYLQKHYPDYLFSSSIKTLYYSDIFYNEDYGYFRLMSFIENSHTLNVVGQPQQAFEAAAQFGKFTRLLSDFDVSKLKITLPDFHNLTLRYRQFEETLSKGNTARIQQSEKLISAVIENKCIVAVFEKIKLSSLFKLRVTHHDTKINNVLFDENNKGMCVIDLDTLMPGYFISDVGDMMRTYLSPVSEEEKDFSKIEIRDEYFLAITEGYLGELKDELSQEEKKHFIYAGKFMIYMQAIRFLTDYLKNDIYYGAKYEGHNFVRAGNQLTLLDKLIEKEDSLQKLIATISANQFFTDTL